MPARDRNSNEERKQRGSELAEFFLNGFPKTAPERLEWYSRELGIRSDRLLRLAGVPADEMETIRSARTVDWTAILKPYPETAWRAANLIGRLFWHFDYDKETIRNRLKSVTEEGFYIIRPDVSEPISIGQLSDAGQEQALFPLIVNEDFDALLAYLSVPGTDQLSSELRVTWVSTPQVFGKRMID